MNNSKKTAFVQSHILNKGKNGLREASESLAALKSRQAVQYSAIDDFDTFLDGVDVFSKYAMDTSIPNFVPYSGTFDLNVPNFQQIEIIEFSDGCTAEEFYSRIKKYAADNSISFNHPLSSLLSCNEVSKLKEQLDRDFTYKRTNCDKFDYLIAGICGAIGALVDIFGVGEPGKGFLGELTDSFFDKSVEQIASWAGWPGPRPGKDSTNSAIGWLERNFLVPYDHETSANTDGLVKNMSLKNHHIKSLAHSPDPIGLLFSIIDQFYSQGTFISNGKLVTVEKASNGSFELRGGDPVTKVGCAFVNWLMHLASDMAGSSGASGRGSGIPMPFQNLLTCLNIGSFGQYNHTLGTIFTQVFEQGYDLRHGVAMSIPVLITELLIRLLFTIRRYGGGNSVIELQSSPDLQRMLFVGHGILCLGDSIHAYVRSGGEIVQFLINTNLIAWTRFGMLAYKEFAAMLNYGHIDAAKLDVYIEDEYSRLLNANA